MARNYATYHRDDTYKRDLEVPVADWDDGMNYGGSNAMGIGINTGDYNPKPSDWARIPNQGESGHIGLEPVLSRIKTVPDGDDNVFFTQAEEDIPPDSFSAPSGGVWNRTGKTVPTGAWFWGSVIFIP